VREDILPDNRLSGWDADTAEAGDQAGRFNESFFFDSGLDPVHRFHDHDGLIQIGISSPFAQTIDGYLNL
jgi:hypothetical protein